MFRLMMTREVAELTFDDGGMNLLSSAALDESPRPMGTRESMRASKPDSENPAPRSAWVTPCT